jgi:hypothetical protein
MNDLGRELMRGVAVGTGKPLDEVGQRLATLLTRLFTSRDLQESKARLEESQRVAHVGYWVWNLDTDRVTWSDETYRIFGLKPQEGPNIATADQKRLVIVGATGMVGGYALHYALENPAVASVTAIGRRKLGISHPKLTEVLHPDFADCSPLAEVLSSQLPAAHAGLELHGPTVPAEEGDSRRHMEVPGGAAGKVKKVNFRTQD